jgi:nitrile hydratase subunit beta
MNGIHDMGGMQGMGPLVREANEPTFHHPWEGRVYAIVRALRTRDGAWCLDANRHQIERLPPADYLRMTYYERWAEVLVRTLLETGTATQSEIDAGHMAAQGQAPAIPRLTAANVSSTIDLRPSARRDAPSTARFKAAQRVRARNMHPMHHTRLPRYARGKTGVVVRDRGVYLLPDTHAHDRGENPEHLYSVRFTARELWGDGASPRDSVYLDMWDSYLEHA